MPLRIRPKIQALLRSQLIRQPTPPVQSTHRLPGIVEALLRARERGVDVRLIADKRTPCERKGGIEALAAIGTPIWIDRTVPIAHAKTMVIDGAFTLMGSYNWTRNAARNSEDLNLVASRPLAAAYAAQWRSRRAVSVPFAGREDWCRPRRQRRNSLDGGG